MRNELAKSPKKILARAFREYLPVSEKSITEEDFTTNPTSLPGNNLTDTVRCNLPSTTPTATSDAYFEGLRLIKILIKLIPQWLYNNRIVFDTLLVAWKSHGRMSRLQNEQELDLVQVSLAHIVMWLRSLILSLFTAYQTYALSNQIFVLFCE